MKTLDRIPTSKIERATKLVSTGAKIGVNYIKYYGDKIVGDEQKAKTNLDQNNAKDIYNSLKELKGSALKVAQMLSMEKSLMPRAYVEQFSLSQFQVPPLSPPLVNKTFKKYFGKTAQELFDRFDSTAKSGASIGQVHQAEKDGKKLAVKIQYPGVSDSISSDLALVKPVAMRMFNIQGDGSDQYFQEIEGKLIEETDYEREITQSIEIVEACKNIEGLSFPNYYPALSTDRIITMDWMQGKHLSEFVKTDRLESEGNTIGQSLWDFYMFQIHKLRKVHADPHPGNFLVSDQGELIVLDFGCMKTIPEEFYKPYFEMTNPDVLSNPERFESKLYELEILRTDDSPEEKLFFSELFHEMLSLFTEPFQSEVFNFADPSFFDRITELGQRYAKSTEIRKYNANRGSKHFIYMNRTFFGLYNLMFDLQADHVKIKNFQKYL